jgi:hypothetical protein
LAVFAGKVWATNRSVKAERKYTPASWAERARGNIKDGHSADAAKQFMAELQPWIEREKAEDIKRIVAIAKGVFRRLEELWDENAVPEARGREPYCRDVG